MNVLSLFDGISCARVALDRVGLPVKTYLACEIDPKAIAISQRHYPDIVRLGDVREVYMSHIGHPIDLMIGGSPCQDLSIAKKGRQGLAGSRSSLFWEYVRIWKLLRPRWFILENVASMPKADRDTITETMGVEPILIDAALVSAQSRKRLFWTNLPVCLPADRGIRLKDILEPDAAVDESLTTKNKSFCLTASYHKAGTGDTEVEHNRKSKQRTMVFTSGLSAVGAAIRGNTQTKTETGIVYSDTLNLRKDEKANALTQTHSSKLALVSTEHRIRKLTPVECERLQGLPDGYTEGVAKTHRYKALGNAFNVDVIAHVLTGCTE